MPRSAAITIFCTPTSAAGSGASSRSSISLVNENSMTSGSAVFCSAVSTSVSAMTPGQQLRPVGGPRRADLGQHAAEHEQEEDRLQQRLGEEARRLVADRHPEVALAQREEGAGTLGLAAFGAHRSSRPVRCTKTSSSVPSMRRSSSSRAPAAGGGHGRRGQPSTSP